MKRRVLCAALLLACSAAGWGQELTWQRNDFRERTEFRDAGGRLTGWARWNDFRERTEFYDAEGRLVCTEVWNGFRRRWEYFRI